MNPQRHTKDHPKRPDEASGKRLFGTFLGVFTPSVLTILGVMMYLRFGWVVGHTGMLGALLIVLMASAIAVLTALSASAIATNMRVGAGGEYYMISRSLGIEVGGAIGIPLFLCRTLSLTLYAFGLTESLAFFWPSAWGAIPVSELTIGIIAMVTLLAGKSAEWSLKLQIPIMAAVFLSVAALAVGVLDGPVGSPLAPPTTAELDLLGANGSSVETPDFWFVFAVFFPAVTGFMAGIGMSGDLRDPRRSIPRGTLAAVATGTLVYVTIVCLLGVTQGVSRADLIDLDPARPPVWTSLALFGAVLIYPGMWGAILSSAIGSALSAPRVLQALARDGLAPGWLGRPDRRGEPLVATLATGAIAIAGVALGDLNTIGKWVTIIFLTLYLTINLAAGLEKLAGDPFYRPTLRVPVVLSLLGAGGCIAAMWLIDPVAFMGAFVLELVLLLYLRGRTLQRSWGDVWAGVWMATAKFALLKLKGIEQAARNWRPHILVFSANPAHRLDLVRLASWFNQDRGIITVSQIVWDQSQPSSNDLRRRRQNIEQALESAGLTAFCQVDHVKDLENGIIDIIQANGFAGLSSNTVLLGWPNDSTGLTRLLRIMRHANSLGKSTILAHGEFDCFAEKPATGFIDLWWRGREQNGDLMVLLVYLLSLNAPWRACSLRLRSIVEEVEDAEATRQNLEELIAEARIPARCEVLKRAAGSSTTDMILTNSREARLVVLGLGLPSEGQEATYAQFLWKMAAGLNHVIFVRNAGEFAGKLI